MSHFAIIRSFNWVLSTTCGVQVHRFTMSQEEVVACAEYAMGQGMGTLMLQSGELPTQARIDYMLDVVRAVRQRWVHHMGRAGRR